MGPEVTNSASRRARLLSRREGRAEAPGGEFRRLRLQRRGRGRARADRRQRLHPVDGGPSQPQGEWYRFIAAMDIPETADLSVPRRNSAVKSRTAREMLAITPGPRSISGASVSGGPEHAFDNGMFTIGQDEAKDIYLGELQTDDPGPAAGAGRARRVEIADRCTAHRRCRARHVQQRR